MVEAAHLGDRDDLPELKSVDRARLGCILRERQMGACATVLQEIFGHAVGTQRHAAEGCHRIRSGRRRNPATSLRSATTFDRATAT